MVLFCITYMVKLKTRLSLAIFAISVLFLPTMGQALAACPVMWAPPEFTVMPDDNTLALVVYSEKDKKEILVLEPAFHGSAQEFGMVLPLPNKPTLEEADEEIFQFLEKYTNPPVVSTIGRSLSETGDAPATTGVTIIETKDVGDFSTVTLTASDSSSLIDWLDENGYAYTEQDRENIEYYVQKQGYYFVAMKVNMENAKIDFQGNLEGKLRPIEFSFTSEQPMLPFRIMAHDMPTMSLTLYTLSSIPYFISGTDVIYKEKLSDRFVEKSLENYDPQGKWLIRMNFDFDPTKITKNIVLSRAADLDTLSRVSNFKINTDDLPYQSGVLEGKSQTNIVLEDFSSLVPPIKQVALGISPDSVDCKNNYQLLVKNEGQNSGCFKFNSVNQIIDRGWSISYDHLLELDRIS